MQKDNIEQTKQLSTEITLKRCKKCGEVKPLDQFNIHKDMRDGHESKCKTCRKKYSHERYEKAKERHKQISAMWRKNNSEKCKETARKWRKANIAKKEEYNRQWRKNNPEKAKAMYKRAAEKRMSTPKGKLSSTMSRAIRRSLRNGSKNNQHWSHLVGYTTEQLIKHLEKKFQPGMTWENYGQKGWHIDHKIPIAAFNYETSEDLDFKKAWALNNLQPMWARDNHRKSNKLNQPFQPSFVFKTYKCGAEI